MKITGGMALRNGIMFQTLDHTATGIINSKGVFDIKVKERLVAKSPLMSHVERFVNRVPIIRGLYVIFENKLFLLSFMLLSLSKYVTHKESVGLQSSTSHSVFIGSQRVLSFLMLCFTVVVFMKIVMHLVKT